MNLKLNNEVRRRSFRLMQRRKSSYLIKEERRRTGRYMAILVGISLFLLAIYHAWVRRIPIVASLVVPALIMFVYVGWVLYTASRDKHRLMDAEAAMQAALDEDDTLEVPSCRSSQRNMSVVSSKSSSMRATPEPHTTQESQAHCVSKNNLPSVVLVCQHHRKQDKTFIKPIILINDEPEDLDQKWNQILEIVSTRNNGKGNFKGFANRTKFKRKFCRSKRNNVFKRSYSIA